MRSLLDLTGSVAAIIVALGACNDDSPLRPTDTTQWEQDAVNVACARDSDCSRGGGVCRFRQCICTSNSQCPKGKVCSAGTCVTGDCVTAADCAEGQVCSSNQCSPCVLDGQCGPGQFCATGVCTADASDFVPTPLTLGDAIGLANALPLGSDSTSNQVRQTNLAVLSSAGVHINHFDLTWTEIEPSRGTFDFTMIDTGVADMLAAGITPLPIFDYGNPWATALSFGNAYCPPDNPQDFATYAGTVVTRLKGKVPAYEIWNEENIGIRFWLLHEDPGGYDRLLEAASSAIRAADPATKVLVGGLYYHGEGGTAGPDFLNEMYNADPSVAASFDGVNVHPYAFYPPSVPPEYQSLIEVPEPQMIQNIRAVMASHGDATKPIYVTEVGWPTYLNVSGDQQARWMVRSILLLLTSGAERVIWYTLEDGNNPNSIPPQENYFGLMNNASPGNTPTPKPGWTALSNLLSLCGQLKLTADLRGTLPELPADAYAYRLEGPHRGVTVLWRSDESASAVNVAVPVSGAPVQIVALDGAATPTTGNLVNVSVAQEPIYVVETF
jgi:hypothetical protein